MPEKVWFCIQCICFGVQQISPIFKIHMPQSFFTIRHEILVIKHNSTKSDYLWKAEMVEQPLILK